MKYVSVIMPFVAVVLIGGGALFWQKGQMKQARAEAEALPARVAAKRAEVEQLKGSIAAAEAKAERMSGEARELAGKLTQQRMQPVRQALLEARLKAGEGKIKEEPLDRQKLAAALKPPAEQQEANGEAEKPRLSAGERSEIQRKLAILRRRAAPMRQKLEKLEKRRAGIEKELKEKRDEWAKSNIGVSDRQKEVVESRFNGRLDSCDRKIEELEAELAPIEDLFKELEAELTGSQ